MHSLHKILVRVKNGYRQFDCETEADLISDVRAYAEDATESYQDWVFDWRETATAGRWENEYPVNVVFSRDGINRFIAELNESYTFQQNNINFHLGELRKISTDLEELVLMDRENKRRYAWDLQCLAEALYGTYTSDSGFYNTEDYNAKITPELIERVRQSPDDWALVMFDCHF